MGKKKNKLMIYGLSEREIVLVWGPKGAGQTMVCQSENLKVILSKEHLQRADAYFVLPDNLSKWKLLKLPKVSRAEGAKMVAMSLEKSHDFQEKIYFAWQVVQQDVEEDLVSVVYCLQSKLEPWLDIFASASLHIKKIITLAELLAAGIKWDKKEERELRNYYGVIYQRRDIVTLIFVYQNRTIYARDCPLNEGLKMACLDYNNLAGVLSTQYQLPKIDHCYLLALEETKEAQEAMRQQVACLTKQIALLPKEMASKSGDDFFATIGLLVLDEPLLHLVAKKEGASLVDKFGAMRNLNYVLILLIGLSVAWLGSWSYLKHQDQALSLGLNQERMTNAQIQEVNTGQIKSHYGQCLLTIAERTPQVLQVQRIASTDFGLRLTGMSENFEAIGIFGLALGESGEFSAVMVTKAQVSKKIQPEETERVDFVLDLYIDGQGGTVDDN